VTPGDGLRIAVVGSGLAGLTATWLLGRRHRVVVYEAEPTPGMGAHSVRVGGDAGPRVDVPLRVFTPGYYPTLLALYRAAGVDVRPVDYAASFSHLDGETYFSYRNVRVAGRSLPWIPPGDLLRAVPRAIAGDLLRLHRQAPAELAAGHLDDLTIESYLRGGGYSSAFIDGFVVPAYAAICTCPAAAVRAYPARVIVDYMCSGVTTRGVMRAVKGSADVIRRLLAPAEAINTDTRVCRIAASDGQVRVETAGGGAAVFDHVVVAARADQTARLVHRDPELTKLVDRVPHARSRVVVHGDPRLAPRARRGWRPVNFITSPQHDAPMATIWLNRVQGGLEGHPPLFQSWNPIVEPDPKTVVTEARVSRPVVTVETARIPADLATLHRNPQRRVWPVGSYAEAGIPLLEAAAVSAMRVARTLGVAVDRIPLP
jgi:predicted NAD/FAD-binding protein